MSSSTIIKENALKKRKSIKSYRKEQERITQMRNKLFEEKLQERRQSELDKIKQNKKYNKMSLFSLGKNNKVEDTNDAAQGEEENGIIQRIKNTFNKPSKSIRKKKSRHSRKNSITKKSKSKK